MERKSNGALLKEIETTKENLLGNEAIIEKIKRSHILKVKEVYSEAEEMMSMERETSTTLTKEMETMKDDSRNKDVLIEELKISHTRKLNEVIFEAEEKLSIERDTRTTLVKEMEMIKSDYRDSEAFIEELKRCHVEKLNDANCKCSTALELVADHRKSGQLLRFELDTKIETILDLTMENQDLQVKLLKSDSTISDVNVLKGELRKLKTGVDAYQQEIKDQSTLLTLQT